MRFSPSAFSERIETRDTTINPSDYAQVINDIKRAYRNVILHETREKTEGRTEKIEKLPAARFRHKIVVEHLSDHMLPISSISESDGVYTIRLNENFVLFLYELRTSGLAGDEGDIFDGSAFDPDYDEETKPDEAYSRDKLGNMYESLLFSVAIHDIRGNFIMKDGAVILNMDRDMLRREWGNQNRFVNYLAISYFWLATTQGLHEFNNPEALDFIRTNREVFSKLGKIRRDMLPGLLLELSFTFMMNRTAKSPDDLKRVPLPTPAALFRLMREGSATTGDIRDRFNWTDQDAAQNAITLNLSKLIDLGVIRPSVRKSKIVELARFKRSLRSDKDNLMYEIVPMTGGRMDKIQQILDEFETSVTPLEFSETKAKMKILELIAPDWAKAVIREASFRAAGETAENSTTKTVVAIDTGWIPVEQQTFVQGLVREVEKLERLGSMKAIPGDTGTIARELAEMVNGGLVRRKNIVILAGKDALEKDALAAFTSAGATDTDTAFVAGVDPKNLTGNSYIRLMEMLTMALRMSSGKASLSDHTGITVILKNPRTAIFIPKAEPFDSLIIRKIYSGLVSGLHS